ncbi:hypothetical protein [Paraburkholderia tuberum]|uniref:hypothetical protein n=1 Tax=Paraburkholderia tuberum TaxID=157910 RepID=UPI00115FFF82|nr:hypothetical protein [Paraburkholderia tuberum]
MNFLSIDICSRRPEREVQFFEALMFNGYQYRRTPLRCGGLRRELAELKEQADYLIYGFPRHRSEPPGRGPLGRICSSSRAGRHRP